MSTPSACFYGHLALLTDREDCERRIRLLAARGWSVRGLAELFGVNVREIERITTPTTGASR